MKSQTKKLFAFIIALMMLSISYLKAQCPGNKVQMFKPNGRAGCASRCVSQNQVDKYLSNGWWYMCYVGSGFVKRPDKKIPNKLFVKIPAENTIVTKKMGRK